MSRKQKFVLFILGVLGFSPSSAFACTGVVPQVIVGDYVEILGRSPRQDEIAYWSAKFQGTPQALDVCNNGYYQLALQILQSPAASTIWGPAITVNVPGYGIYDVDGGPAQAVSFINLAKYGRLSPADAQFCATLAVSIMYNSYLHRAATQADANYWVGVIMNPYVSAQQIEALIASSQESLSDMVYGTPAYYYNFAGPHL